MIHRENLSIPYAVGLGKAKNRKHKEASRTFCHCLHFEDHSQLKICSFAQEGNLLLSKDRAERGSFSEARLPNPRSTMGLEQGGDQANKGTVFNLANATGIFAGTIMDMLFAVRHAFPQQTLPIIYPLGVSE